VNEKITVRYRIPLDDYAGGKMLFYQWIPVGSEDALTTAAGDAVVRIYVDRKTVDTSDEALNKTVNLPVTELTIEVELSEVTRTLVEFIHDERDRYKQVHHGLKPEDPRFNDLTCEYEHLGYQALEAMLQVINRLLGWARAEKGQHWLTEVSYYRDNAASYNVAFKASVRSRLHDWTCWYPPAQHTIRLQVAGEERSIRFDDWQRARQFVSSGSKTSIVRHLLANAEELLSGGHIRSSIIEAASALELATFAFGKNAQLPEFLPSGALRGLDVSDLHSRMTHLGVSTTVSYLLPLLFSEKILSDETIDASRELLNVRNNVVHQGQRIVKDEVARRVVTAARSICETLMRHTRTSQG
jgi:hypothetical protein